MAVLITAGCTTGGRLHDPAITAEKRAIDFLKREVPLWSKENGCFSCHNNGDAARALYVASRRGYRIPPEALADTTAWVVQPAQWDHNKGDPGFSDQRLADIQFGASLLASVEAGQVKDRSSVLEAARKISAHQDASGAWTVESHNEVGSPATYGTILGTYMALQTLKHAPGTDLEVSVARAEDWLRQVPVDNIPAAATFLLAFAAHQNTSTQFKQKECLDLIHRTQTREGGWGPYPDSPAEAFDTALVLLALSGFRSNEGVQASIQRGRSFLVALQEPSGGWPATTRPPGGESYAQHISTTGWVTLALLVTRE